MQILDEIVSFIEGVKSVVDIPNMLKEAISNGVKVGVEKAKPVLIKVMLIAELTLAGIVLIGLGMGTYLESVISIPGVGFALAGMILIAASLIYAGMNKN